MVKIRIYIINISVNNPESKPVLTVSFGNNNKEEPIDVNCKTSEKVFNISRYNYFFIENIQLFNKILNN